MKQSKMPSKHTIQVGGKGMSVLAILGAGLVLLKAAGFSTLSWGWTLAPFWIPWVIIFGLGLIGLVIFLIALAIAWMSDRMESNARRARGLYRMGERNWLSDR